MSDNKTYPPLNMHFIVQFQNKLYKDSRFQSVEGLGAQMKADAPDEKPYTHFDTLVLTRAYESDSKLVEWCMNALNNHKNEPQQLTIQLLSPKHRVLCAWIVEEAVPVGWGVAPLHAQESNILLERIELAYDYFQVVDSSGTIVAPVPKEEE